MGKPKKKKARIHDYVAQGRLGAVKDFWEKNHVEHPRCLDARDEMYRCPIHIACSKGKLEILQFLLEKGVSPNSLAKFGYRPLHLAVITKKLPIVEVLVEAGADINAADQNGVTPLLLSCTACTTSAVPKYLAKNGADVMVKDVDNRGVLHHLAAGGRSVELARWFVDECGVDPLPPDNEGQTPFLLATQWGHKEVLKYMIEVTAAYKAVDEENLEILEKEVQDLEIEAQRQEEEKKRLEEEAAARAEAEARGEVFPEPGELGEEGAPPAPADASPDPNPADG